MPFVFKQKLKKESRSSHFSERGELQFVMTLAILMSMDNKCFLMRVHTLAQLFSPSSSVAKNNRIPLSLIVSRIHDAKAPDQYGEFLQWLGSSKKCDISFDLKVVFTILMYSSPSSVSPLNMGTLKAGILVSVFLTVELTI